MKTTYKKVVKMCAMVCAVFLSGQTYAQQLPLFTQYTQNPLTVNPGFAGSNDVLSAVLLSRIQWTGIEGAPRTTAFSIHSPLKETNLGAGLTVVADRLGQEKSSGLFADFNYRLQLGGTSAIRLGLRAGGSFYSASLADMETVRDDDPAFASNISSEFLPNFGFGAYFTTDKYFAGLSVPKLLGNDIEFNNGSVVTNAYSERQHIFLIAGGLFNISPSLKAKPSVGFRYVGGAPGSIDLTANFLFADKIWLGVFNRFNDSFGGIFQLQVNEQLRFGYSFDHTTSKLRTYNNGTHELMLSYDFMYRRANIKSPRYF